MTARVAARIPSACVCARATECVCVRLAFSLLLICLPRSPLCPLCERSEEQWERVGVARWDSDMELSMCYYYWDGTRGLQASLSWLEMKQNSKCTPTYCCLNICVNRSGKRQEWAQEFLLLPRRENTCLKTINRYFFFQDGFKISGWTKSPPGARYWTWPSWDILGVWCFPGD